MSSSMRRRAAHADHRNQPGSSHTAPAPGETRTRSDGEGSDGGGGAGAGSGLNSPNVSSASSSSAAAELDAAGRGRQQIQQPHTSYADSSNGHVVAYDPRDLMEEAKRSRMPRLTMMEEVLLLGLDDKLGHLSLFNDSISYALRGCIMIELAFRDRIRIKNSPERRRLPLADRLVEIIDSTPTGEVLMDEAMGHMRSAEKKSSEMSVGRWIDALAGEALFDFNNFQLRQVRERLAKGLVDKGILRNEKRNLLLFDMVTHPVTEEGARVKDDLKRRVASMCTDRTVILPGSSLLPEDVEFRYLRSVCMVCMANSADVLTNAMTMMSEETRMRGGTFSEDLLCQYSAWPFESSAAGQDIATNVKKKVDQELEAAKNRELQLEIVPAVLSHLRINKSL